MSPYAANPKIGALAVRKEDIRGIFEKIQTHLDYSGLYGMLYDGFCMAGKPEGSGAYPAHDAR